MDTRNVCPTCHQPTPRGSSLETRNREAALVRDRAVTRTRDGFGTFRDDPAEPGAVRFAPREDLPLPRAEPRA